MSLRLYAADANVSQWSYVQQFKECGCEIEVENDDAQPEKKQASVTKFSNILRDEFFFLVFYFRLLQFIAWPWIIHLSITHPGASEGVLAFVQVIEYIIADFQINVFTSSRAINHPIPLHAYM